MCFGEQKACSGSFGKGVSPVIATVLLVMVTVGLVFYVSDYFQQLQAKAQDLRQIIDGP